MKRCSRCKQTKPIADFAKHAGIKGGLAWWCKACTNAQRKAAHAANPARNRRTDLKRYYADPLKTANKNLRRNWCNVTLGRLGDTADSVRTMAAMLLRYLDDAEIARARGALHG